MATNENVALLGEEVQKLSANLARLAEIPNRTISAVSTHLSFLLSLAVRKVAFGPNEWAKVPDEAVEGAIEVIRISNEQAAEIEDGQDAMDFAGAVTDAINALEALQ
jgi:hypothetical protein